MLECAIKSIKKELNHREFRGALGSNDTKWVFMWISAVRLNS